MRSKQLSGVVGFWSMCLCACLSASAAQSSSEDWQFTTGANPSIPTVETNAAGTAQATVFPGSASSGWLARLEGFGTQTGLWDLGGSGRVSLTIPNSLDPAGNAFTDLSLKVVQFFDGSLYPGDLTFSIPDSGSAGRTLIEELSGLPGSWFEDTYVWHLVPAPAQVSLTITGAVSATVLDRIRVEITNSPPQLMITSVAVRGQVLSISWQGGLPPYQVYLTTNLADSAAWQPLGVPTSQHSADVPMDHPVSFVKVRGSN